MSDSTDPTPADPTPAPTPVETVTQSVETTVAAYGQALADTLSTLETIAAQAPGVEAALEADVQDLIDATKLKISTFLGSIESDVTDLLSTGG
jgi:hypothetical protein